MKNERDRKMSSGLNGWGLFSALHAFISHPIHATRSGSIPSLCTRFSSVSSVVASLCTPSSSVFSVVPSLCPLSTLCVLCGCIFVVALKGSHV